jgi:hypothetical protein
MRTTLGQVRQSRLPQSIGRCANDLPEVAAFVNQAQQQLINAGGETGFWGGWEKVAFQATRCNPYITLPRKYARAINLAVCRFPIRMQNEFYELLPDGIGLQDFCSIKGRTDWCGALEGYERGTVVSMTDLTPTNQLLRVYLTDPRDIGKRILIGPAQDQNGNFIYTQDGNPSVNGFYLTLAQPFTTSAFVVTSFSGVQKDATYGDVLLYQVDATTGAQVLLSRYAPDEITPAYRRFFIKNLPCGCHATQVPGNPCVSGAPVPDGVVTVTALCKLEFIPANRDTDYLIIGNIPALIEECKAIRYSDMDEPNAVTLEGKSHQKAIKYLNDELRHYLGELQPAVNLAPFGTATLRRQRIGTLI